MKPRIGVLFNDSSILIVMDRGRSDAEQIEEAQDLIEGANSGIRDSAKKAKLLSIIIDPSDWVELTEEDLANEN